MTDEVSNVDVVLVEPITQYVTTEPTVNDEVSNVDVVLVEPITHLTPIAETFTKLQVDDGDALEEQKKRKQK